MFIILFVLFEWQRVVISWKFLFAKSYTLKNLYGLKVNPLNGGLIFLMVSNTIFGNNCKFQLSNWNYTMNYCIVNVRKCIAESLTKYWKNVCEEAVPILLTNNAWPYLRINLFFKTAFLQNTFGWLLLECIFGIGSQKLCAKNFEYEGNSSLRLSWLTQLNGNIKEIENLLCCLYVY